MRSIFVRIFLSFLMTILLISTAVVVLTYLRNQEFPPLGHQDFVRAAVTEYGHDAIQHYERGGEAALDSYISSVRERSGIVLALFDDQIRPLGSHPAPRRMARMAQRALRSGEVVFPVHGSRNGVASVFQGSMNRPYVAAFILPQQPQPQSPWKEVTHGFLGWRLLILLLVAGAVCYVLARSLAGPIQRLRQATRKFAAGDLSVRIGSGVRGKNEIAGLARDFDEMAGKIEDLVDSQKRLLRDISHELRSPLTRLGLGLELARTQENPEAREKALARIELESERMNTMIGQLLELTRLESGMRTNEMGSVNMTALLNDLVRDARFEAEAMACEVALSLPQDPVNMEGSEDLLRQTFDNIIRNALKYTSPETSVEIELTCTGSELSVDVLDRGPGVPDEALDKLFAPFYRVADARDRESGGTGIGLAIAERSVSLHGGTIKATNRPGGGLHISASFPLNI